MKLSKRLEVMDSATLMTISKNKQMGSTPFKMQIATKLYFRLWPPFSLKSNQSKKLKYQQLNCLRHRTLMIFLTCLKQSHKRRLLLRLISKTYFKKFLLLKSRKRRNRLIDLRLMILETSKRLRPFQ